MSEFNEPLLEELEDFERSIADSRSALAEKVEYATLDREKLYFIHNLLKTKSVWKLLPKREKLPEKKLKP